jgi:multicomponent Na+:H+ antiporter subunit E
VLLVWTLLSFSCDWQHLIVGVSASVLIAMVMGDMFTGRVRRWAQPRRYLWFFRAVVVFWWECIKANIDVALRVINPRLPINPGIVKVKTTLKTETGIVFLANFITLTPGTLTVDVDQENGFLYIHWIDVKAQDVEEATRLIVAKFERLLKEVFE